MNFKIRKFLIKDLDQILEIEKNSFPKTAYSKILFEKLYQKYPQGFLVAEKDGKILGYIIGNIKGDLGEIISLAVDPKFRRKKIASSLCKFLIDHFKEKKLKKIFLYVRIKNEPAILFYQKLGFKILKESESYYPDGENAYLMEKEI